MAVSNEECYNCDAYDEDREGCTLPSCDKSYACSKVAQKPEPENEEHEFTADDNDAHVHDYSPWGICSICGAID